MKLMPNLPTRKWVSSLLFLSLLFSTVFSTQVVRAQTPDPQSPNPTEQNAAVSSTAQAIWTLEYHVPVTDEQLESLGGMEGARLQMEQMLASKDLQNLDIRAEIKYGAGASFDVVLQGNTDVDFLRQLIFARLSPELDILNGPIDVNLTFPVEEGQVFSFAMEGRPATGFGWEIAANDSALITQEGEMLVQSKVEAASAPASETMRLRATGTGKAVLHALYQRPWEASQAVTRRLTVELNALPGNLDLSNPAVTEQTAPPELEGAMLGEPTVGLPASWDWRSQGKVPPVRNQGGCGSCWAFGTVGMMETAMMVQAGFAATDLSEQYLISCNTSGYSCNGGWWAHDYHQNKLGKSQTAAGAVLESAKPYTATNGTCSAALTHTYQLASWGYVSGAYNALPTVDTIKNAIYTYGGVSAAVCAGSKWGGYSGGVFATDEKSQCTGSGQVNHAILLVGWNDADQTWILRNSWGAGWGEGGYMRIKWGTSNVGYGATYVQINAPTPAVNDNFSAATAIDHPGGPVEYRGGSSTTAATIESSDPIFATSPASQGSNSVWYKFTPVSTGALVVDTYGSSYDTLLGVWTGQPGALKLVKWNDNSGTRKQSAVSFTTGKGITYYIEVAAKAGPGQLAFHLKYTPATVANNSISYATAVKSAGVTVQTTYAMVIDVSRATVSTSDPLFPDYGRGYRTVWYKFTAPRNGSLSVNTNGSNYANLLGVWQKVSTKFTLLGSSNSGNVANVALVSGKTYFIEIASQAISGPSALTFNLNYTPNP